MGEAELPPPPPLSKMLMANSAYVWHMDDIQVHKSDIPVQMSYIWMAYEYIRET